MTGIGRVLAIACLAALCGCIASGPASGPPAALVANSGPLAGGYQGADAGYLIVTLAAAQGTRYRSYSFYFRRRDGGGKGSIWWGQDDASDRRPLDIDDGAEQALIDIRRLPPGDYEIYNFDIVLNPPSMWQPWFAARDFAIPFTIAPGRATYIGELKAVALTTPGPFGNTLANGAYFVLSDKSARDLAIARRKEPGLPAAIADEASDARAIGHELIRAGGP